MAVKQFRIHGDNFVECERFLEYMIKGSNVNRCNIAVSYPSLSSKEVSFFQGGNTYHITLLSGFNKRGKDRWDENIFDCLKTSGSFLNETPDALLTELSPAGEKILCAVEFCSALQAGNQAWQRSGRAMSVGRTGCSYLYIVDIGNTELEPGTRKPKTPRIPNPIVPYSYESFADTMQALVVEVCVPSAVFSLQDDAFKDIFRTTFAEREICNYIWSLVSGANVTTCAHALLEKNRALTEALCKAFGNLPKQRWSEQEWNHILNGNLDALSYAASQQNTIPHTKKIAGKSYSKNTKVANETILKYSKGCACHDLPFGIIPGTERKLFFDELKTRLSISPPPGSSNNKDLVVCLLKGFKPKGDDDRPDRGALPLIRMLDKQDREIFLYIYGPLLTSSYSMLHQGMYKELASSNGLWNSFLSLADYILIDSPVIKKCGLNVTKVCDCFQLFHTNSFKTRRLSCSGTSPLLNNLISLTPKAYQEEDVDFAIHNLFTEFLCLYCFEGMCNPPGGDWSGLSIRFGSTEYRWLSLPRASKDKRPDHVIVYNINSNKQILLLIESKESLRSLKQERQVGSSMKSFIDALFTSLPNVERSGAAWKESSASLPISSLSKLSAGAYISNNITSDTAKPADFACDMLFILQADENTPMWKLCIRTNSNSDAKALASHIQQEISKQQQLFEIQVQ